MLYGTWVVGRKLGESYRFDIQEVSDVIGKTFMFSRGKANLHYYNQELEINYPEYKIVIIPLDEETTYFPYMLTIREMGITGNYIILFSVTGCDIYFIIKDDESLIMFYKDAYLELKRIDHIEGYDSFYHAL